MFKYGTRVKAANGQYGNVTGRMPSEQGGDLIRVSSVKGTGGEWFRPESLRVVKARKAA